MGAGTGAGVGLGVAVGAGAELGVGVACGVGAGATVGAGVSAGASVLAGIAPDSVLAGASSEGAPLKGESVVSLPQAKETNSSSAARIGAGHRLLHVIDVPIRRDEKILQ